MSDDVYEVPGEPNRVLIPLRPKSKDDRKFPPEKQKELEAVGLRWCPKQNRYVANTPGPCKPKPKEPELLSGVEGREVPLPDGRVFIAVLKNEKGEQSVIDVHDPKDPSAPVDPKTYDEVKTRIEGRVWAEKYHALHPKDRSFEKYVQELKEKQALSVGRGDPAEKSSKQTEGTVKWNAKTKQFEDA